jgi:hypothetical protein
MTLTTIILALGAFLLACYDIVVAVSLGPSATLSAVLYKLSQRYPVIPFVIGFVLGHIFWSI